MRTTPAKPEPSAAAPLSTMPFSAPPGTTPNASLRRSRYNLPTPTIEVRLPRGAHYRLLRIALHQLAALVEGATPQSERWCVQIEQLSDGLGHVYLELLHATDSEAQRGLALLQAVRATIPLPTTPS